MGFGTQPRDRDGRWAEKPGVGLARRMTEALREALGHDGLDPSEAPPPERDVDEMLAEQALLEAVLSSPRVEEVPVPAGRPVDELIEAQAALLVDLERKAADGEAASLFPDVEPEEKVSWDPDLHPRDWRGRFASIGSTVALPSSAGGGEGRVVRATGRNHVLVRRGDGSEVDVDARDTEVTRSAAANAARESFNRRAGAGTRFRPAGSPTRAPRATNAPSPQKPQKPQPSYQDAVSRVQQELDDSDNGVRGWVAEDPSLLDQIDDALREQDGPYLDLKPPGGTEMSIRREDGEALVRGRGGRGAGRDRGAEAVARQAARDAAALDRFFGGEPDVNAPSPKPSGPKKPEAEEPGPTYSDMLDELAPEDMSDEQLDDALALAAEAGAFDLPKGDPLRDRADALSDEKQSREGSWEGGDEYDPALDEMDPAEMSDEMLAHAIEVTEGAPDTEWAEPRLEELNAELAKRKASAGGPETLFSDADVEGQPSGKVPAPVAESLASIPLKGNPQGTGTREDPIDVGGDIDAAVQHLAAGRHVRLSQPDQVATLLDRLSAYVEEAKAKGQDAPNFDLCGVSVPGTNLFCAESQGIPRANMPQLSGTPEPDSPAAAKMRPGDTEANITDDFVDALRQMGIGIERQTVPASHLRATQNELDGPKVAGMSRAMADGKIPDKPIFVTRDGYIIDGHHRWASKVAIDLRDNQLGDVEMPVDVIDLDIGSAIDFANEFALGMGIRPKGLGAAAEGVVGEGETLVAPGQVVSTPAKGLVGACLTWSDGLRAEVEAQTKAADALVAGLEEKAGGVDRNRGHAERLRRYWTHGEGAAKIGWGGHGDFYRCVAELTKYLGARAKGYCNLRHQEAVGGPPGKGHGKALVPDSQWAVMEALGIADRLGLERKQEEMPNENPDPTGVMVALYPPDDVAQALALDTEGAEAAPELHVTLAYLGSVEDVGAERVGDLVDLVAAFAADSYELEGAVSGLGRWDAEEQDAFVALVDAPDLPDLRADLVDALAAAGFEASSDHGFTPHVTLAYLDPADESPLERLAPVPATFGMLSLAVGPDVWDFPMAAEGAVLEAEEPPEAGEEPPEGKADWVAAPVGRRPVARRTRPGWRAQRVRPAGAWTAEDERLHPRTSAGQSGGGRFRPKNEGREYEAAPVRGGNRDQTAGGRTGDREYEAAPVREGQQKPHVVESGDTLSAIAQRAGVRWQDVYRLNRNVIEEAARRHGRSGSEGGRWIYPGTRLRIPPRPTRGATRARQGQEERRGGALLRRKPGTAAGLLPRKPG